MAGAALALFLVLGEFYLLCVNGCVSLYVCVCVSDRHDDWMYVVPYSIDLRPRVYVAISE